MSGDPADIGRAPESIFIFEIENPFDGLIGIQKITCLGVQHTLRFAGAAASVKDESGSSASITSGSHSA